MKRAPHPVRLCQYNWDEDWLFRTAVPGSNAAASAACGWRHQGQRGNQKTAQFHRKAGFAAHLYTAKRMICFFPSCIQAGKVYNFARASGHKIHVCQIEDSTPLSFLGKTADDNP
jgi:hypothetical protein